MRKKKEKLWSILDILEEREEQLGNAYDSITALLDNRIYHINTVRKINLSNALDTIQFMITDNHCAIEREQEEENNE